ncbi:f78e3a27-f1e0-46e1-abde-d39187675815 [Thermothielavioides terrestris]|uniref:F78e3a27-f1e0-46e1-abde-d39187675815 n=1 Tax=Thermothielavioides terrestris TaxID=2587410 RepID=A0A446BUJ1_9PEZI|nr:f78e3a27-f1e0-46e1-abde-d39187675815 [Thermothielavioides terrestris]
MARRRRDQSPSNLKLKQPDRSGPTEKTLLQLAEERGLFEQAKKREDEIGKKAGKTAISRPAGDEDGDEAGLPPAVERVLETLLWAVSLAMLHFTLDVLVHHQYSIDRIVWPKVWARFGQALFVFGLLIYVFHPHAANPRLVPGLAPRFQSALRQAIFLAASISTGCYLIHITNTSGYMAVMKQAPSVGCLWVWPSPANTKLDVGVGSAAAADMD